MLNVAMLNSSAALGLKLLHHVKMVIIREAEKLSFFFYVNLSHLGKKVTKVEGFRTYIFFLLLYESVHGPIFSSINISFMCVHICAYVYVHTCTRMCINKKLFSI